MLEINVVNYETNNSLKQYSYDYMEISTENIFNKLLDSQPIIENTDYTENKIKIVNCITMTRKSAVHLRKIHRNTGQLFRPY